jgi:CubicO group peptidase (beta-lactamase class C family)
MKRYPLNVLNLIAFLSIISLFSSCYMLRAYKFRNFKLTDHTKLDFEKVEAPTNTFQYTNGLQNNYSTATTWLDENLKNTETASFLVIKNDSIVYERYFDGFNRQSLFPSFSIAKSFVSTLVGIALEEGKIKSLQEPFTNYIPEFLKKDSRFGKITIQNLLDMRSGIKWSEGGYGLKDDAIKLGFRPNMWNQIKKIKIDTAPKDDSEYKSINSMLLGIIIKRATGKNLVAYLQEKIWQPLGMETTATWNTDKKELPITYGGLNATARDFAKLGSLFLKQGNWNGKQIISKQWINNSVHEDTMFAYNGYRNQWWGENTYSYFKDSTEAIVFKNREVNISKICKTKNGLFYVAKQTNNFYAQGILGQFVYVVPDKNIVIVRTGHYWSHNKFYLEGFLRETQKRY